MAGTKLTAADGLSRRPLESPIDLEVDEELQQDSFIAQIDPDIFQPVANDRQRPIPRKNSQHVSPIGNNDDGTVSGTSSDGLTNDLSQSVKAGNTKNDVIDLWSAQELDLQKLQ